LQQYSALKSAFILPVLMYVLRDVFAENKVDFVKYCVEYDL